MGAAPGKPLPGTVAPLAEDRYRVQFTATPILKEKIERARALLWHRHPSGDLASVVERALDQLIDRLEREKLGKRTTERKAAKSGRSTKDKPQREVPGSKRAAIRRGTRREVNARDRGQCAYVGTNGERCSSREHLEFDHRVPKARGGRGDAGNVRLLCRAHNRFAAEQAFGRAFVERKIHLRQHKSRPDARADSASSPSPFPMAMSESTAHFREHLRAGRKSS
jgi:5-methylcytosine-specific restriction endonuclease McrA